MDPNTIKPVGYHHYDGAGYSTHSDDEMDDMECEAEPTEQWDGKWTEPPVENWEDEVQWSLGPPPSQSRDPQLTLPSGSSEN